MINDRGTKKWTAFMMPEHIKSLRGFIDTLDKVERPILDNDQLEEMNNVIDEALEYKKELVFTYYKSGDIKLFVGFIHSIDEIKKEIRITDEFGDNLNLKYEDILRVDINS